MASYTGGGISTVSSPTGAAGGSLTGSYPNPTLSTVPSGATGTTQAENDASTKFATTAYVDRVRPDSYFLNGSLANVFETMDRRNATSAAIVIAATGIMTSYPIVLHAGAVITNLNFMVGSTASGTIQNFWVALYDTQATPALIAQSTNVTSGTISASVLTTKALASPAPYTVTTTGVHWVAWMLASAGTINTMSGVNTVSNMAPSITNSKSLGRTSGSGLTTTAPGTITSASVIAGTAYCVTN